MSFTYKYPRPAVTVDCVVFGFDGAALKLLLVRRKNPPFAGAWALPGGFVHQDESLEAAALRELSEETGLHKVFLEQLYSFGDPHRDPRGRVITVAYYALIKLSQMKLAPSTDAEEAGWFEAGALPELAFDHDVIISIALERLRGKVVYQPLGFELLAHEFTLTQLQKLYEVILGRELDKRNFRKKMLQMGILVDTGKYVTGAQHRAPQLFRFDERRYRELKKQGFVFEL